MSEAIHIGLLGLGTVGSGVLEVIQNNAADISLKVGTPINIKTILVKNVNKHSNIAANIAVTDKWEQILEDDEIDIIVEVMGGISPAKEYMLQALKAGKHVVTANKDVVAQYGKELFAAAEEGQVDFFFEGSVAGGIPIIRPLKQCLAANRISEVMGIVNGTTNYMLTKMSDEGLDFAEVLAEAQAKGYAEADPTADVGGFDAARKAAILASIAFNARVTLDDVYVEGICDISAVDIEYAKELGYVIKLLAIAKSDGNSIDVRVHPTFLPCAHPLAAVRDVFNAVFVRGDAVGETMFYGRGAGKLPTASAVVADVIDVARDIHHNVSTRIGCTCFNHKEICSVAQTQSPYYIRLLVEDKPGVLAAIAGAFGAQGVSLQSVIQKRKVQGCAELVLITYEVLDSNIRLALKTLEGMSTIVNSVCNVIRVEGEVLP